ncbi:MAG: FixH family protein [Bacteroidetes bacterium]|nr:FixH family protein [Bacteroidota bacterium]
MSWGKKIISGYLLFVIGILFLVVMSMRQSQDLVTKDYYDQELVYQDRLDEINRADSIENAVTIDYANQAVSIQFADTFKNARLTGNVWIYCPDDATKDLKKAFSLTAGNTLLLIPCKTVGFRRVKVSWQSSGISYYKEKDLFIANN